jgi:hypothetical protein
MAGADLISVNAFARQSSIWTQVTPTMEPMVRWMNTHEASLGAAVPSVSDNQRHALIAEAAFLLAGSRFRYVPGDPGLVEIQARRFLQGLPRSEASHEDLNSDEWVEIGKLARVIQHYTSYLAHPVFSAEVPGCGVVDSAICDLLADEELIEIKTVTRPFRSLDLRQVLTYAAMLYASNRTVPRVTLLNPRLAVHVTMSISDIARMTRGDSAVELLQDLVESMMGLQVSA